MKKTINNLFLEIFIFISLFMFSTRVSANTINNIEMDVYIDLNGNAQITEIWNTHLNKGTEGYKTYTKLGNSIISNFSVTDETGIIYENLSNWNPKANFNEKSYKSGINYISDGLELCWGISEYGNKKYTLKYTINNFVTQYTDNQGIYFNFINLDQNVDSAKITLYSDYRFSLDNSKIWAFGNNGTINFENGKIILDSKGTLSSEQYMVALIKFQENIFNISNMSDESFDDIYDSALKGTVRHLDTNIVLIIMLIGLIIVAIVCYVFINKIFGLFLYIKYCIKEKEETSKLLDLGEKLPDDKKINYFYTVPCNNDLGRAYWLAYHYKIVSIKKLRKGIIGAMLLKWIKKGYIAISETENNKFTIDFSNAEHIPNIRENDLLMILKSAASDNKLEATELKKWYKKNYSIIETWFLCIDSLEQDNLEQEGLITENIDIINKNNFLNLKKSKKVDSKLREEALQLKGFKKFLLDFIKINNRNYEEVYELDEYLIFAQLLGIANKVEKQFKDLYPDFAKKSSLNIGLAMDAIKNLPSIPRIKYRKRRINYNNYPEYEYQKYKSSNSSNYSHSSTRSSGGGGSSYSSGGRSSGGSSGGGFR